jgi:hypothetical protein
MVILSKILISIFLFQTKEHHRKALNRPVYVTVASQRRVLPRKAYLSLQDHDLSKPSLLSMHENGSWTHINVLIDEEQICEHVIPSRRILYGVQLDFNIFQVFFVL